MIIILGDFFIHFTELLINAFIRIIDFIVSILNRFDDESNESDEENSINAKNEMDSDNDEIFKLSNFLKNDSIFEELENRYSKSSSLNQRNSYNESQNIFASLKKNGHESTDSKLDLANFNERKMNIANFNEDNFNLGNFNEGNLNKGKLNDNLNSIEGLKRKIVYFALNNRFFKINESNLYGSILRFGIMMFIIVMLIVALIGYFVSLEMALAIFISFLLLAIGIVYYPKIKKEKDYSSFSKDLPYVLRQLATELRSGRSLFDSMNSIVDSDYGVLSLEFSRVLEEIKYGESTENAFLNLEKRVGSPALSRVIYEILTSLRIGSNLSSSLTIIADDVNFDIRMKLKEYSEKLNAFIMIYTFLAILAPVILLTILLAASVVIGDLVPGDLILILYSVFFPMIIVFLGFAIKKLEPKL